MTGDHDARSAGRQHLGWTPRDVRAPLVWLWRRRVYRAGMPLTLIKGTFRVLGASPDGDSVRFYPEDRAAWTRAHVAARTNAAGGAQLRLDAIDALETHYQPPSDPLRWHQPSDLGAAASSKLLELLAFDSVTRDANGTVTAATPSQVPGRILTRFADKYGRPVVIAFAGEVPTADGTPVWLQAADLRESVNYQLLASGLVYPTYYSKLYVDLRAELTAAAGAARSAAQGVWANDVTTSGFELHDRSQLQEELVILPKLFRRLADYLSLDGTGGVDLSGFAAFLGARNDLLFTVPDGHATNLATLVEVSGQRVRLTVPPERIVFLEA